MGDSPFETNKDVCHEEALRRERKMKEQAAIILEGPAEGILKSTYLI